MLLNNFITLTNLATVYSLAKPTDKRALARILARFSLLMLGANALTITNPKMETLKHKCYCLCLIVLLNNLFTKTISRFYFS